MKQTVIISQVEQLKNMLSASPAPINVQATIDCLRQVAYDFDAEALLSALKYRTLTYEPRIQHDVKSRMKECFDNEDRQGFALYSKILKRFSRYHRGLWCAISTDKPIYTDKQYYSMLRPATKDDVLYTINDFLEAERDFV